MIINLPPDTLAVQQSDDSTNNPNMTLNNDRAKEYVWDLFVNDSKLTTVEEVEKAFKKIIVYHYMFMSDLDTVNYAKMLELLLTTLIKSDIFEMVSVDYNILNYVLNGKQCTIGRNSTNTTIVSRLKDGMYHMLSTSVRDSTERDCYYVGPFIINFKLNGELKHCVVNFTVDSYNDRGAQPECMMMKDSDYNKFKTSLEAVLVEYPQYDIKPTLRNYDESLFLRCA